MDVANTQAVVTGAASGIGEAIAQRLLEAGACVVIGDLDAVRLEETSSRLDADHPGRIAHVDGDASDPDHVAELIASAGDVDIFFANAGVFKGFGLQATDDEWDLSWDVNVKAHVVAARALVPTWLERGAGCFVSTASAAGLLTQLGSPTYSVTKHAAVGSPLLTRSSRRSSLADSSHCRIPMSAPCMPARPPIQITGSPPCNASAPRLGTSAERSPLP